MTTSNTNTLLSGNAFDQLHQAAKTMHDLADRLDRYNCESDPCVLSQISSDLSKTGWNSLFAAALIDDLVIPSKQLPDQDLPLQTKDLSIQAHALFTAIKYFSKSILVLKENAKQTEMNQREELQFTLRVLSQRLKEVLNECKSF
jgi:hypothetical protein